MAFCYVARDRYGRPPQLAHEAVYLVPRKLRRNGICLSDQRNSLLPSNQVLIAFHLHQGILPIASLSKIVYQLLFA